MVAVLTEIPVQTENLPKAFQKPTFFIRLEQAVAVAATGMGVPIIAWDKARPVVPVRSLWNWFCKKGAGA